LIGGLPPVNRRAHSFSIWKSLQGPGNDWPLALCDPKTVDPSTDIVKADLVFTDRFTEIQRIYYNPNHKWYYVKDLANQEVIVFRQTDSDQKDSVGGSIFMSMAAQRL
jgi:hypothetical protein